MPRIASVPSFLGIDADEERNRVVVRIATASAQADVRTLAEEFQIPQDALSIEPGVPGSLQHSLSARIRPTSAGYSIQNDSYEVCTLAWNVHGTGVGEGFLTASHCDAATVGSGGVNDYIHQPTRGSFPYTQNRLGYVHTNPAWTRADADCMGVSLCALADAMFVKYANTPGDTGVKRVVKTTYVATNYGTPSLEADFWFVNPMGATDAVMNSSVDKVGRTTGWTRGTVNGTCVNEVIDGSVILCSDRVTGSRTGGGDSGAPVFTSPASNSQNAPYFILGVYYAGTIVNGQTCTSGCLYWYSRWGNITAHLNLALCPLPGGCDCWFFPCQSAVPAASPDPIATKLITTAPRSANASRHRR